MIKPLDKGFVWFFRGDYILKISTNFIFRKTLYISTDKVIDSLISKELKMIKPNIFQYKDMKIVFKNFV